MKRKEQIGFSQRIQLDWLEYTTNLVLAGNSRDEIIVALRERLRDQLSVGNDPERGNRDKAITILTKVWVTVPNELQALRDEGLRLLQRLPASDRMLVHWCMCMAVYPFFGTVAEATGRLLKLQGTAAAGQVQRRVREKLGERETVSRAARRIIRVFVDWETLLETDEKGIYRGASKRAVDNTQLVIWSIQASLFASNRYSDILGTIIQAPRLFPFSLTPPTSLEIEAYKSLSLSRQGFDHELIIEINTQRSI